MYILVVLIYISVMNDVFVMIQANRVIDLLYTKYLTAEISYDNITRIEHYPFPKDAIREAIFNALIHQDFSVGVPVQISVYKDKLYISNDCVFPANWTADTLIQKHRSLLHNPDIADTFFRAGFIENILYKKAFPNYFQKGFCFSKRL